MQYSTEQYSPVQHNTVHSSLISGVGSGLFLVATVLGSLLCCRARYTAHCIRDIEHFRLYIYTSHLKLYTLHFTFYNLYFTLHTLNLTLNTLHISITFVHFIIEPLQFLQFTVLRCICFSFLFSYLFVPHMGVVVVRGRWGNYVS